MKLDFKPSFPVSAAEQSEAIAVTLADGTLHSFSQGITPLEVAEAISPSLQRRCRAARVDDQLTDLSISLRQDCRLQLLTADDESCLEILRHDMAHIMAQAVMELYEDASPTIGPVIDDGFYYDFAREEAFTPQDLQRIEKRMHDIVKRNDTISREEWHREDIRRFYHECGNAYKVEILDAIPADESLLMYRQGDFIDLCRGPHFATTGQSGHAFKLMKVAGAYWRGDSTRPMLQRIYGTAWHRQKDLDAYLHRLEEAAKRDHRLLGRQMKLFHFQEEAPGAVFWHDRGSRLFRTLISYLRRRQNEAGYEEINTPEVLDRSLWEASGHWETFREHMFTTETEDGRIFAVKPMNCPGGMQVYRQGMVSYRDLPRRIAEFGKVHRYEPSGALHGLMRVRAFTQDDAHIYCTFEQMQEECRKVIELTLSIYKDFGFENVLIKFADRPAKRIGDDASWDVLEQSLQSSLQSLDLSYEVNHGEGAFYGPKIEFVLLDSLGRHWQCGTLQVDMSLPQRLHAHYVGTDGEKHHPVMLHRALFGSLERFIGIILEHYGGHLPFWLSPCHVAVASVTNDYDDYATRVSQVFASHHLFVEQDARSEKISYKIREHSHEKCPVIAIVGGNEERDGSVTLRRLGGSAQQTLPLEQAATLLSQESQMPAPRAMSIVQRR